MGEMKWIIQSSLCTSRDCELGVLIGIFCIVEGNRPLQMTL